MTTLTAVILTLNEVEHIEDCIASIRFADHILVFDSYSTDDTVKRAKQAGAEVIQRSFDHYAGQRNAALAAVKTEWVLFIDADERVTMELAEEIRQTLRQPDCVGYGIPRHNYIFGKLTRGAGWYPDYQIRLLKVNTARYDPERQVHETVILDGQAGRLQHHLTHYNYVDGKQFAAKQRKYTAYEAQMMYEQGIYPKPQNYILQPLRHFRWRFFTLKGYRDGLHGFRLSLWMSWYEFHKYILLRRLWAARQ